MYKLIIKCVRIYADDSHEYIESVYTYDTLEALKKAFPLVLTIYKTASLKSDGVEFKDRKYRIQEIKDERVNE